MNLTKIVRRLFGPKEPKYSRGKTLEPKDILESNLSPKKIKGLKVTWDLTIQTMQNEEVIQDTILVLTSFARSPVSIWIMVNTVQYPEIYTCMSGSKITVEGEVYRVERNEIYLQNCQLVFLKNAD